MSQSPPSQNSWSKPPPASPADAASPAPAPPKRPLASAKAGKEFRLVGGIFAAVFVATLAIYIAALMTTPRIVAPVRVPPPTQNGFPLLKAATDKPVHKDDVGDAISVSPKKKWTLAGKRKLVDANRSAILATRKALTIPYREENRAVSINDEFPYYAKFRHMARVLVLAGNVVWEEGKQREAADYYLDALTIGRRVPHRAGLISRLVGIACESISRRAIWDRLARMDAPTTAHCLTRLQALQAERLPYSVTLEEEKYTMQHVAMEGMKNPDVFLSAGEDETPAGGDQTARRVFRAYRTVVPRKYVADTLGSHMDKLIAQSRKPYIEGNAELPVPKELYTSIMMPTVRQARLKYVHGEAGDALLRTALALRLYKARNGKYPSDLSELVAAKLLPAVPDDPFDLPGASLHYASSPMGKYVLYSIGPDGTDDGGKGIEVKSGTRKPNRTVALDSQGDMVAGWHGY